MTMLERVARALCSAEGIDPDGFKRRTVKVLVGGRRTDTGHDSRIYEPREYKIPNWSPFETLARAAVEAMREPTDEMFGAGGVAEFKNDLAQTPPRRSRRQCLPRHARRHS